MVELGAALAAGNPSVALVSEQWPLRSSDLGEIVEVADVPPDTVKRVVRLTDTGIESTDGCLARLEGLTELKTAWHPVGA